MLTTIIPMLSNRALRDALITTIDCNRPALMHMLRDEVRFRASSN